jgi:AraC-like DNA-binding protein
MESFRPVEALRTRVKEIRVLESAGGTTTVLPAAAAVLGIQYRGRVRAPDGLLSLAGVTGLQHAARRYEYEAPTASVLVMFTPQGAACFGAPASELSGHSVPLDALLSAEPVRTLTERVAEASTSAARVARVEEFLLALPFASDRLVARAIERLSAPVPPHVALLARELGVSERQLERRFLARVGITPKRFASLRRFERALALSASADSLGRLAQDAGYYDQSHFIREFRSYTGEAPSKLLARPR